MEAEQMGMHVAVLGGGGPVPLATVLPSLARHHCKVSRAVLGGWTVATLMTTAEDLSSSKQSVVANIALISNVG